MLEQVTQRVWCLPWEEERDRPSLYYIRGDRRSLAVDAGSSPAHVAQFYAALEKRGLPLPDFTAVTHWHWDHTFGLGAVQGVTLASALTNRKLRQVRAWEWTPEAMAQRERRGEDIPFCNEHIRREYPDLGAVSVSIVSVKSAFSSSSSLCSYRTSLSLLSASFPALRLLALLSSVLLRASRPRTSHLLRVLRAEYCCNFLFRSLSLSRLCSAAY